MLVLVAYDVSTSTANGRKRLAKLARLCCNYGQRVQNSVFECDLDYAQYTEVKAKMLKIIDTSEDNLRLYNLGNKYNERIENFGRSAAYDPEGELIF